MSHIDPQQALGQAIYQALIANPLAVANYQLFTGHSDYADFRVSRIDKSRFLVKATLVDNGVFHNTDILFDNISSWHFAYYIISDEYPYNLAHIPLTPVMKSIILNKVVPAKDEFCRLNPHTVYNHFKHEYLVKFVSQDLPNAPTLLKNKSSAPRPLLPKNDSPQTDTDSPATINSDINVLTATAILHSADNDYSQSHSNTSSSDSALSVNDTSTDDRNKNGYSGYDSGSGYTSSSSSSSYSSSSDSYSGGGGDYGGGGSGGDW